MYESWARCVVSVECKLRASCDLECIVHMPISVIIHTGSFEAALHTHALDWGGYHRHIVSLNVYVSKSTTFWPFSPIPIGQRSVLFNRHSVQDVLCTTPTLCNATSNSKFDVGLVRLKRSETFICGGYNRSWLQFINTIFLLYFFYVCFHVGHFELSIIIPNRFVDHIDMIMDQYLFIVIFQHSISKCSIRCPTETFKVSTYSSSKRKLKSPSSTISVCAVIRLHDSLANGTCKSSSSIPF